MNLWRLFLANASELVHFRKRIGEKGIELILSESIRVNDDKSDDEHHGTACYFRLEYLFILELLIFPYY